MTFREIYEAYKIDVFNLALHYTGNVQDAEEITQDVFVKVHENLHRFREEARIRTWVYRITVHQALDFLKARKRRKRVFWLTALRIDDQEHKADIPDFQHPGVLMEQKEALEHIFRCLYQLPDNQRTVLILLKLERLSQQETAEVMQLGVKAVESLFQRAKKNLEKLLTQNEGA